MRNIIHLYTLVLGIVNLIIYICNVKMIM